MGKQRSLVWEADLAMSHAMTDMTGMQDPSKRFGEIVAGIENLRKMLHDEIFLLAPFLDGEMLDVDVPSTGSRTFLIHHMASCHVINEQTCRARSKSVKHSENAAKTLGNLPARMQLFHAMAAKQKSDMGCIKAANQLILENEGERRKIGIFFQNWKGDVRKSIERQQMAKHNAPQLGALKACAHSFQSIKMVFIWTVGEMGKKTGRIADIKLADNMGKDRFSKNVSMGETFFRNNLFGFRHLLRWTFESHRVVGHNQLNRNRHRTIVFIKCRASHPCVWSMQSM